MKLKKVSQINGVVSNYESDNEREIRFLLANGWILDGEKPAKTEPQQEEKVEEKVSEIDTLRAKCDELGIKYAVQAGVPKLTKLINEYLAEQPKDEEKEDEVDIDL